MKFLKPKFWDVNKISIYSIFLLPFSFLFQLITLFRRLTTTTKKYQIPTICIGNIYLGGTGKTPLSYELFKILKNLKMNPVFIRKSYESFKDEINLLKQLGPVIEKRKRGLALNEAIKNKYNIAILDDGFQDFSVKKDKSIICFNEKQWIGNGFIIPAGPLREGMSALSRADIVFINGEKNLEIENKLLSKNKLVKIFYSIYKPQNINEFINKKVICFAGIGNPNNFFNLLKKNEIKISEKIIFPDHYKYSEKDIKNLINKAKEKNAILLTTEKDYLRIEERYKVNIKFLKIKVEIQNCDKFIEEIKKII
tara:strand:- start:997 stop:1926 length:930 start_codon:yes stop_codon:yes gene_type:complete